MHPQSRKGVVFPGALRFQIIVNVIEMKENENRKMMVGQMFVDAHAT